MIPTVRSLAEAQVLAMAIVNTLPEPFLVLDEQLRVLAASRAFYDTFKVDAAQTQGCLLYALGDGQWDIPALRLLLETIVPDQAVMDGFEVEHDFPGVGQRIMLLNARKVLYEESAAITILLAFHDVTVARTLDREKATLLLQTEGLVRQKQVLLDEMQHRVANSLQIIASILLLKARGVSSEETRFHLKDAHQRVMSVAAIQSHLHAIDGIDQVEVAAYLSKLGAGLASSMVGENHPIAVTVIADSGMVASAKAVSLGLIVTELVINAIKYAFPEAREDAAIRVTYETRESDWKLVVSDNGVGKADVGGLGKSSGLGTAIIGALAKQLGAKIETVTRSDGRSIAITKASYASRMQTA